MKRPSARLSALILLLLLIGCGLPTILWFSGIRLDSSMLNKAYQAAVALLQRHSAGGPSGTAGNTAPGASAQAARRDVDVELPREGTGSPADRNLALHDGLAGGVGSGASELIGPRMPERSVASQIAEVAVTLDQPFGTFALESQAFLDASAVLESPALGNGRDGELGSLSGGSSAGYGAGSSSGSSNANTARFGGWSAGNPGATSQPNPQAGDSGRNSTPAVVTPVPTDATGPSTPDGPGTEGTPGTSTSGPLKSPAGYKVPDGGTTLTLLGGALLALGALRRRS